MQKIIFISSLIFIASCTVNRIPTLYGKCGKGYYACTQIYLKENQEFEFFQFYDVGGGQIVKGKWEEKDDTITLNTFEQQKDRIIEVIESSDNSDKFKFEILNDDAFISYNSIPDSVKTSFNGYAQIQRFKGLVSFEIILFSDPKLIPILYKIKDTAANYFIIKTKQLKSNLFLENDKYMRKGKRLYWLNNSEKPSETKIYYEKEKLSNKQF